MSDAKERAEMLGKIKEMRESKATEKAYNKATVYPETEDVLKGGGAMSPAKSDGKKGRDMGEAGMPWSKRFGQ